MSTFTERKAIQETMDYIRGERRRMADHYFECMARLRQLDEEEKRDGTFTTTTAPFEELLNTMAEAVGVIKSLVPSVSKERLDEIAEEELRQQIRKTNVFEETTHEKTTTRRHIEEEEATTVIKRRKQHDLKKEAAIVASTISEYGRPVKFQDLLKKLEEDHEITWKSPYTAFTHILEHEPRIERASRGYYQVRQ